MHQETTSQIKLAKLNNFVLCVISIDNAAVDFIDTVVNILFPCLYFDLSIVCDANWSYAWWNSFFIYIYIYIWSTNLTILFILYRVYESCQKILTLDLGVLRFWAFFFFYLFFLFFFELFYICTLSFLEWKFLLAISAYELNF